MKNNVFKHQNHEFRDFVFDDLTVRFIISDKKQIYMNLLPTGTEKAAVYDFEGAKIGRLFDNGQDEFPDAKPFWYGMLVHLYIRGDKRCCMGDSYKFSSSAQRLIFSEQSISEESECIIIKTLLREERYSVLHQVTKYENQNGVVINTKFINTSSAPLTVESITSASLDNLSPFRSDDSSEQVYLHSFRSAWSAEGRHICEPIASLNLNKAWGDSCESIKKGSIGSRACFGHYPYIALEDRKSGVIWGMKLYHNATWQSELTRCMNDLSLSIGIGDMSFGAWCKTVEPGGKFETPCVAATAVKGDIAALSNAMLESEEERVRAFEEDGLPMIFNAYCSVARPSSDNMLRYLDLMSELNFKYFIMDAGWYENEYGPGIGDWQVNKTAFPGGLKDYADKVRERGFIPGIWFEFECCNENSEHYSEDFADMHLKKDGYPLICRVNMGRYEKFFDFTNRAVIDYLDERVVGLLKDCGFGYLKIDYNTDIGIGCDGAESYGEGLRIQMEAVYGFIRHIRERIPGIVIESCASGGGRADGLTLSAAQMCSFSDAHESVEFPIIAANQHLILPPAQSQIWCTLRPYFSANHLAYSISAGFLGRLCWSGNIEDLSCEQFAKVKRATDFYNSVSEIIKYGDSFIHRTHECDYRKPTGTQTVIRYTHNRSCALIVYHRFYQSEDMKITLDGDYSVRKKLFEDNSRICNGAFLTGDGADIFGNVILIEKKHCI